MISEIRVLTNGWSVGDGCRPYRYTSLSPVLFAGRTSAVMRRCRSIGMWCRGWICRGMLDIATRWYNVRPRSSRSWWLNVAADILLRIGMFAQRQRRKGSVPAPECPSWSDYQLWYIRWRVSSAMSRNLKEHCSFGWRCRDLLNAWKAILLLNRHMDRQISGPETRANSLI